MLDTVIGPVTYIIDNRTFEMNVTHIGRHNQFQYNDYEKIIISKNNTPYPLYNLQGKRVRCSVKYRDVYNRLFAEVELE